MTVKQKKIDRIKAKREFVQYVEKSALSQLAETKSDTAKLDMW